MPRKKTVSRTRKSIKRTHAKVKRTRAKVSRALVRRGINKPLQWFLSISGSAIIVVLALSLNLNVIFPSTNAATSNFMMVEAENMNMSTTNGVTKISDSSASGGKAVKMTKAATISTTVQTGVLQALKVSVRGTQCSGAPSMTVKVDGKTLGTTSVTASGWIQYTYASTIDTGNHVVEVGFTNPHTSYTFFWASCTRSLFVDKIEFQSPTVVGSPTPAPTTTMVPTGVPGTWALKFDDEFNGTSLDTTRWSKCRLAPNCGSMNNATTSASNVAVTGGNLVLTLASSNSGAYVSTLRSDGATTGYLYTTGVVEARIYFPGDGTHCYNWPAWWSVGPNWPADGEHDIAETTGYNGIGAGGGSMTINYHSSKTNMGYTVPSYWCGGYHIYTLNKKATSADIYYDGKLVRSYLTNDTGAPHYLVLNVGSGGTAAYGTASQVKVDYVRAWQ